MPLAIGNACGCGCDCGCNCCEHTAVAVCVDVARVSQKWHNLLPSTFCMLPHCTCCRATTKRGKNLWFKAQEDEFAKFTHGTYTMHDLFKCYVCISVWVCGGNTDVAMQHIHAYTSTCMYVNMALVAPTFIVTTSYCVQQPNKKKKQETTTTTSKVNEETATK